MESVQTYLPWIVGLPLIGFLVQALIGGTVVKSLGTKLGREIMGWAAVLPIAAGFVLAALIARSLAMQPEEERLAIVTMFDWVKLHSLNLPFELRADTLSITMALIVTGVGALIHLYATAYMVDDKDYTRFFTYLNLFIAFMLLLVLGNNLVMLFIGWEGVGVCSYLLIGFWYKDHANAKAANKAFIVNRIGDVGLTLGMFLLVVLLAANRDVLGVGEGARWLSYDVFLTNASEIFASHPTMTAWICGLFFIGAMGKSAQFPLYVWLPDAMAGPTPVSALIHAATMVTAGVFLLARMGPVFDHAPVVGAIVAGVGALTALVGAAIAFGQTDIKKVLAFSTVSQLGYMFVACGVGAYWVGIFHVATHAFFKALLFLGSGAVIHAMAHNKDMRNYGNLRKYIPITFATMAVGWAAIAGFPFFAGAVSKEEILLLSINSHGYNLWGLSIGQIAGWVGVAVAILTAAYMTRLLLLTFFSGEERWKTLAAEKPVQHTEIAAAPMPAEDEHGFFLSDEELQLEHEHAHGLTPDHTPREVHWKMWAPLVVLAVLSVVGGIGLFKVFSLRDWLGAGGETHAEGGISTGLMLAIAIGAFVIGSAWAWWRYSKRLPENEGFDESKWHPICKAASQQFGFDRLFSDGSIKLGGILGRACTWIDRWIIDGIVNGVGIVTRGLAGTGKWVQSGNLRSYALTMEFGFVVMIGYVLYKVWTGGGD